MPRCGEGICVPTSVVRKAQDWLDADGAAEGTVSAGATLGSPTVMLCTVILSFGVTLLPSPFATVAILPILATVSRPPVTLPTIEYCGSVFGVKSLKKIRNWLPVAPGWLPIIATVPFGYSGATAGVALADALGVGACGVFSL